MCGTDLTERIAGAGIECRLARSAVGELGHAVGKLWVRCEL